MEFQRQVLEVLGMLLLVVKIVKDMIATDSFFGLTENLIARICYRSKPQHCMQS